MRNPAGPNQTAAAWVTDRIDGEGDLRQMRHALVLAGFLALQATSFAQTQNALPGCNGDITLVRVSHIKPGGSMEKFMAAAAAHQALVPGKRHNGQRDRDRPRAGAGRRYRWGQLLRDGSHQLSRPSAAGAPAEPRRCRLEGLREAVSGHVRDQKRIHDLHAQVSPVG